MIVMHNAWQAADDVVYHSCFLFIIEELPESVAQRFLTSPIALA